MPETAALRIRCALPGEARALSALALRSKAHWGYDTAFIDATRHDLEVSPESIRENACFVATVGEEIAGFYLREGSELARLFVAPDLLGRDIGRSLMNHMADQAAKAGLAVIRIVSDPHASGFYEACGAVQTGVFASRDIPDRVLPVLELRIPGASAAIKDAR